VSAVSRQLRALEPCDQGGVDVDARLVAAVKAGTREAEEALYRRHAPGILRLATRLLASRDEAFDVLQDTFVVAFENIGDLREASAFGGWLKRIAVRLVHRRFRRRKLLAIFGLDRGEGDAPLESLADESASPETRAELRWLDDALGRADHAERIAWMLRHVEGLALEEVAEALGCSLATAKRRIAAAEARVRAHTGGAR
jgi:RNA polymerase sigma-70 factor (ECF subfamily)